jgi:energy-converting hydrogenase Eha subunit A
LAVLDDIKILNGMNEGDATKDNLFNLYIRKAVSAINIYLNMPTVDSDGFTINPIDVSTTYPDAVLQYVIEHMNKKGNEGLKQFSQGSVSGTYGSGLSDEVKDLLPLPNVGMC